MSEDLKPPGQRSPVGAKGSNTGHVSHVYHHLCDRALQDDGTLLEAY